MMLWSLIILAGKSHALPIPPKTDCYPTSILVAVFLGPCTVHKIFVTSSRGSKTNIVVFSSLMVCHPSMVLIGGHEILFLFWMEHFSFISYCHHQCSNNMRVQIFWSWERWLLPLTPLTWNDPMSSCNNITDQQCLYYSIASTKYGGQHCVAGERLS